MSYRFMSSMSNKFRSLLCALSRVIFFIVSCFVLALSVKCYATRVEWDYQKNSRYCVLMQHWTNIMGHVKE